MKVIEKEAQSLNEVMKLHINFCIARIEKNVRLRIIIVTREIKIRKKFNRKVQLLEKQRQ